MGDNTEAIKLSDQVKSEASFEHYGKKEEKYIISSQKVASIAAGFVLNNNMVKIKIYRK